MVDKISPEIRNNSFLKNNKKEMSLSEFLKQHEGKAYTKKALEWFKLNLGKIVTSAELARITGEKGHPISHNMRRIFELRDEQGYEIINWRDNETSGFNLNVDEWVLLNKEPNPKNIRTRGVNKNIMFEVFERDGYQCQICGRMKGDEDPFKKGHKIKLHVGHIVAHKRNGNKNTIEFERIEEMNENKKLTKEDFITMCNVCNEGAKNKDIKIITLQDRVEKVDKKTKEEIFEYLKKDLKK